MVPSRRERLKHELREDILNAARELFVREGYDSVSMRKLADRVRVSPGAIYHYFKDKEEILAAICEETFAKLDRRMEALVNDKGGDPLESLRRGGRLYINFGLENPQHYFLTFTMHNRVVDKEHHLLASGLRTFDNMRRCVGACVDSGLTRSTDVEEISQTVWAAAHGVVMLLIAKPEFPFIERNRLIDSVLDLCIEGIRKRPC